MTPSEQYAKVTRTAIPGDLLSSTGALLLLAATAALVHGSAYLVFERLLAFPGAIAGRRSASKRSQPVRRIPGLSAGASAVAVAQIRLTLRTPRGRSSFLAPLLIFLVFTILSIRAGDALFSIVPESGIGLAAFAGFFSVMATLPFAMNQFALDGAGLTLELLSPLSDKQLLDGKAVADRRDGRGTRTRVPHRRLSSISTWAPGALDQHSCRRRSDLPPRRPNCRCRVCDISPRRRFEQHQPRQQPAWRGRPARRGQHRSLGSPGRRVAFVGIRMLHRPDLTLLMLLIWCAIALALNRLLFRPVRVLLARRRENLGLVTS